jgi:hypothetical protein
MDLSSHPLALALGLFLVPALIAGFACLAGARRGAVGALGASGLALGYFVGHCATLGGLPSLPPSTSNEALAWIAPMAFVATLAGRRRATLGLGIAGAAVGACGALVLLRQQLGGMGAWELARDVGGSALAVGLGVLGLERASGEEGAGSALLAAALSAAVAGAAALTGSLTYGQFGATLTAVCVAAAVAGGLARGADFRGSIALIAVAACALLGLAAERFSSLPPGARWCLAFAPTCLIWIGSLRNENVAKRRALRWVALGLPLLCALAIAWMHHSERSQSAYPY